MLPDSSRRVPIVDLSAEVSLFICSRRFVQRYIEGFDPQFKYYSTLTKEAICSEFWNFTIK